MKKIAFLILFFCSYIFGAKFDMQVSSSPLISVNEGYGTIVDHKSFIVGSGGVVTHKFSNNEESIIARVEVVEKKDGYAKLKFKTFDTLAQKAFPIPKILPNVGDTVILNYLYDRSLIVVPNKEIYAEIIKAFPNISFIHPDIVGAYLHDEYKPNPSQKDFKKLCSNNGAGLIFIALNNQAVFADCNSFRVLKSFKSAKISYYQLPFYTEVHDIQSAFWNLNSQNITNYNQHYKSLLRVK